MVERYGDAREKYVTPVLNLVDVQALRPLNLVMNSGNGAAGPSFHTIASQLAEMTAAIEFVRVDHSPDLTFPNGVPERCAVAANVVKKVGADFHVAFDGDFDSCSLDGHGQFVPVKHAVGLLP